MVSLMNELPAIGISRVRYPVAPRQLERSRSSLFGMLTTDLVAEGVDEVLFESRSWADHFDRATLANLKADGLVPEDLQVSWPDKREPLLWIADALAGIVGSVSERSLLDRAYRDPSVVERTIGEVMDRPLPTLGVDTTLDDAFAILSDGADALLALQGERPAGVVTKLDLLEYLAHRGDADR